MADTSPHNRKELCAACIDAKACADAERTAADPSFSILPSMQDIIEHEYALVESIPDEDRAALMPIIRFVRNTLQDPFITPYDLSQGCAMDALYVNGRSGMPCREGKDMEGSQYKHMEMMPHGYAFNGTKEMQLQNPDCMLDMYEESMPWQRVPAPKALHQHCSFQCPQDQKEVQDITPSYPTFKATCPSIDASGDDYAAQPQEHRGFALCPHMYKQLHDPISLASPKFGTHENELSSILSGIDMESFHLEELRRSLRPSCHDMNSDVNDIDSNDVNSYSNNVYSDDDNDDNDDDNNNDMDEDVESLSASCASGVAWHSYRDNDLQYYSMPLADHLLQFPKLHCRRRNVVKKAVGWVKKRATRAFASRVRHKRQCNLPCCTGCEVATKRRKVSKKCAKLSTIIKTSPPSTVMNLEKQANDYRQANKGKGGERDMSGDESSDGKDASQVTRDWANSSLTTALIILLMDSNSHGMTIYGALQGLVQQGYSKIIGSDSHALAAHVKTTLKECPEFKELRNHRFILRNRHQHVDSSKQSLIDALHKQVRLRKPHFAHDSEYSKQELSMSQEGCSQNLTRNLGASSSSRKPNQGECLQCQKTDEKHWQYIRNAGFPYCEHHQQSWGRMHGHSSHEKGHPCAYDERISAAKEEEMSIDSCSGQSLEQDTEEAEQIRCFRTDGRSWQCSNQAEKGSLYCGHHQSRCKKGMGKVHQQRPSISENMVQLPKAESTKQITCVPSVSTFSMQLRPRRFNTAVATCLKDPKMDKF